MKYGIFAYGNKFNNYGDYVQTIGVLNVYKKMGIDLSEVISIDVDSLRTYKGEKVILPMSTCCIQFWRHQYFPLSENIIPCFWGFHTTDEKIVRWLVDYENTVFGCRDIATCELLNKSFLGKNKCIVSGCFSLCQEKREQKEYKEVYLVDVLEQFKKYIPQDIMEGAKELTQTTHDFHHYSDEEAVEKGILATKEWLNVFKENAKLVITTRLHVALPCVAMGIPVIVAKEYEDYTDRYSGYEEFFHVYMPNEYANVDWNVKAKDIEQIKQKFEKVAISYLENLQKENADFDSFPTDIQKIAYENHDYFMQYKNVKYCSGVCASYLSEVQKLDYYLHKEKYDNIFEYILGKPIQNMKLVIWGAGDKGYLMPRRYERIIRKFDSCCYVDGDKGKVGKTLNGMPIYLPDTIQNDGNTIVIVAIKHYYTAAGRAIGDVLDERFGMEEGKNYFYLDKLDYSARMAIDEIALNATLM